MTGRGLRTGQGDRALDDSRDSEMNAGELAVWCNGKRGDRARVTEGLGGCSWSQGVTLRHNGQLWKSLPRGRV